MADSLGRHIISEYYQCSAEILNDVDKIEQIMIEASKAANAVIVNSSFHYFLPYGVSGVVVIEESHLAIHTWPEYNYASMDIYTCGDSVNPWIAFDYIKKELKSKYTSPLEMLRGQLNLLKHNNFPAIQNVEVPKKQVKYNKNLWFTDRGKNMAFSVRRKGEMLYNKQSDYQNIKVFDTYSYGKVISTNNKIIYAEQDAAAYHEMMVQPAMFLHQNPENILVVGGGDGAATTEILKHQYVKKVKVVEIDKEIPKISKHFFPNIYKVFGNNKVDLEITDAIEYIKNTNEKFDLIILDYFFDIDNNSNQLLFEDINNILKEHGLLIVQNGSPKFAPEKFTKNIYRQQKIFKNVNPYLAYISICPTGTWSFSICSQNVFYNKLMPQKIHDFEQKETLQYYNYNIHYAAFALPNSIKKLIQKK